MQSMNISLPEPLKQFVDGQVLTGRYSTASEYVRELIREDEKRVAQAHLESMLLEGLSGSDAPLGAADWHALRQEAAAQMQARRLKD